MGRIDMGTRKTSIEVEDGFCDAVHSAIVDIAKAYNSPQRDTLFLKRAGVDLNRALFPLLSLIGAREPTGVVEKAEILGRDYTTVSRQLKKLEELGYIESYRANNDDRSMLSAPTPAGSKIIDQMRKARREYLQEMLKDWNVEDRRTLVEFLRRFADNFLNTPL